VQLCPSSKRDMVLNHVLASLQSRVEELQGLVRELIPKAATEIWTSELELALALDNENIRSIQSTSSSHLARPTLLSLHESSWHTSLGTDERSRAISHAIAEEGRALVDILQLCTEAFGMDAQLLANATAVAGSADFGRCLALLTPRSTTEVSIALLPCRLRLGALGLDALHVVASMGLATGVESKGALN